MRIDIRPSPHDQLNGLTAVPGPLVIKVSWILPVNDTYRAAQVFVNEVNDFETAKMYSIEAGNNLDYPVSDDKVRYFWLIAVDVYGNASGIITGPASAAASLMPSSIIKQWDLATANIVGKLAAGNITGLGALALLNELNASKVTGLGYLATRDTITASRVTNLGALAIADQVAANQIGAGQLAAGVIYAGAINASQITAGSISADRISGGTLEGISIRINGNFYVTPSLTQLFNAMLTRCYTNNGDAPGVAAFRAQSSGAGAAMAVDGFVTQTAYGESSNMSFRTNNIIPVVAGGYNCGTMARPWMGVTSESALVVTSDVRSKMDIADSNLGLDFVNQLRPVSYRLKVARSEITHGEEPMGPWLPNTQPEKEVIVTPVEGTRRHYGLLAQEVKQTMADCQVDDAAFWVLTDPSDPDSKQALRYEELISPMIKAIQELSAEVARLKAIVEA